MRMQIALWSIFAMGFLSAEPNDAILADITPVDLRSDGLTNALAVSATPRLSWRLETEKRGQVRSAWQVLVATRPELLAENRGDVWDSGKVAAKREPYITYSGPPLASGGRYYWKVRCWDAADSPSAWSKNSVMEIAPTTPNDWKDARWIDDGRANPTQDEDFYAPDPAPLLRREFNLSKPVVRAHLHLAGLGYCLPSLNGKRLEDQILDPPWTAFEKRILFRTHDVTSQLAEGENCLGLALGNGWYNPLPLRMWGHRNIRGSLTTGRPRVIAMLVVEHDDGTSTTVTTGTGWTTTTGPTIRNSIFLGEERNSQFVLSGWDRVGFDAGEWKPARVVEAPLEPLQPLLSMPPVRAASTIPAVAITSSEPDVYIVDFGKNFTGVPEVNLNLPAGTRIILRYGEILNEDGTLNPLTSVCGQIKGTRKDANGDEVLIGGPGAPAIAWQQDSYLARGEGPETYRPDFTFHGFRFMEITGLLEKPDLTAFRGIPLYSDLPDAGSFSCSNERLNRIQEITRRTFLNNVVSVQSDCPHRERFAYGGDIVATSEAFIMNFDMAGFYSKTARDWADSAQPDGNFTDTAPFVGIQYCGVGWSMVHPLLLEQLHTYYGDRRLIEEQFPAAVRWFNGEAGRRENGLVTKGLGDHEALKKIAGPVMLTPMFIDTARRMARLARIIGRDDEAARFDKMAEDSAAAWSKAFLDTETGKVGGASQSEQAFALGFNAAPEAAQQAVFDQLSKDLTAPDDGPRLTTGINGTQILLEELSQRGRHDLAYALADRKTFPSWGWMLENDATTLWETWKESDSTFTHNHPMFGSISAWFFRWLGGIQPDADAVGFDRILIRPQMIKGLEWVKCSHNSIRGPIVSNWSVNNDELRFEITIPPDASATIELPKAKGDKLTESGRPLVDAHGITVLASGGDVHRLQAGSGRYEFVIKKAL